MSFWCPFFDPRLTTYHSKRDTQLREVTELRTSTFNAKEVMDGVYLQATGASYIEGACRGLGKAQRPG